MGSEMCIRDSPPDAAGVVVRGAVVAAAAFLSEAGLRREVREREVRLGAVIVVAGESSSAPVPVSVSVPVSVASGWLLSRRARMSRELPGRAGHRKSQPRVCALPCHSGPFAWADRGASKTP